MTHPHPRKLPSTHAYEILSGPEGWQISPTIASSDQHGTKAVGLTYLPTAWTIPWVVLSLNAAKTAAFRSDWKSIAALTISHFTEIQHGQRSQNLIVRSSGPNENLDMRGHFDTLSCTSDTKDLASTINTVAFQSTDSVVSAVIIQPFIDATYRGHLSNEYRHAQRNVDFLYEIENLASDEPDPHFPKSFRLPRPVASPDDHPLLINENNPSLTHIEKRLRSVAEWLSSRNARGHIEWLATRQRFFVVQLDLDELPEKVFPMAEATAVAAPLPDTSCLGQAFVSLDSGCDFSNLRKTRSHALLKSVDAFVPPIFVARDISESINNPESHFWQELDHLLSSPAIIRFDVPHSRKDWTNLPTLGPLTSQDNYREKVEAALDSISNRGIALTDLAVVVHYFISASAAAWSEASPDNTQVRIDAIWGLPDGLQSFPHDSITYDTATDTSRPIIGYKDRFIDVTANGKWIVRRAPPGIARDEVCTLDEVRTISHISARLANKTGRTVRIMWFLRVIKNCMCPTSSLPWIVEEMETVNLRLETPLLSATLIRKAQLHNERSIRNRLTLERLRQSPSSMDIGNRHVLLQPDASAIRDRNFIREFADIVVSLPNQWKVLYAGSMLAHTPYQLQSHGIAVICINKHTQAPRRKYLRKLVRDKIPEILAAEGMPAETTVLDELGYNLALRQKLVEEVLEAVYSTEPDELREELADLLTVAQTLHSVVTNEPWSEVEKTAIDKAQRRGAFDRRLFLHSTGSSSAKRSTPGDAQIYRLRTSEGIRIRLVPPINSNTSNIHFDFQRSRIRLSIEFREEFVNVHLSPLDTPAALPSTQLSLFDE